jgi:hypothetical protein
MSSTIEATLKRFRCLVQVLQLGLLADKMDPIRVLGVNEEVALDPHKEEGWANRKCYHVTHELEERMGGVGYIFRFFEESF